LITHTIRYHMKYLVPLLFSFCCLQSCRLDSYQKTQNEQSYDSIVAFLKVNQPYFDDFYVHLAPQERDSAKAIMNDILLLDYHSMIDKHDIQDEAFFIAGIDLTGRFVKSIKELDEKKKFTEVSVHN